MTEEVELLMDELKEGMDKSIVHLQEELQKIRTGKASPSMLSGLLVEYYGSPTPLSQVANVGTADAKTLTIQPFSHITYSFATHLFDGRIRVFESLGCIDN